MEGTVQDFPALGALRRVRGDLDEPAVTAAVRGSAVNINSKQLILIGATKSYTNPTSNSFFPVQKSNVAIKVNDI
jgi:hypothetical protein